ncbi:hypothetical protein GCM10022217_02390 [Chryseobacterium ginsenosidimutans]|uniref:hypothetical protein n=1 Tax=Chryseobacterium ginsenosidimutans TaxID=687846 RepID=UPI0031D4954F
MKQTFSIFLILLFFSCKNEKKSINSNSSKTEVEKQNINLPNVNREKNNEKTEILTIINAFEKKDEKTLNEFINPSVGFYIIPGPGTLLHFDKQNKISFKNPNIEYHNFGNPEETEYQIIQTNKFPKYSCENQKWDKNGLFLIRGNSNVFSNILEMQILGGQKIEPNNKEMATRIDSITETIFLTKKDGDIIFGFAKIDGQLILTYLDLSQTYCDI